VCVCVCVRARAQYKHTEAYVQRRREGLDQPGGQTRSMSCRPPPQARAHAHTPKPLEDVTSEVRERQRHSRRPSRRSAKERHNTAAVGIRSERRAGARARCVGGEVRVCGGGGRKYASRKLGKRMGIGVSEGGGARWRWLQESCCSRRRRRCRVRLRQGR